jgi:copper homeostasis protein
MPNILSNKLLEIACFNIESCLLAEKAGADRIEFCADYSVGGITPNRADILKAKELLHIPLHVIIRPRGGNFDYSLAEIETIKNDILFCKQHHINGVVFGVLTYNKKIDTIINKELIELAGNMSTTFHRAIDECADMIEAMNDIVSLGFKRVLTSGGKSSALEGVAILKNCQNSFGKNIIIIPGGGIRSNNLAQIATQTNCKEFHSAAIIQNTEFVNATEVSLLKEKLA